MPEDGRDYTVVNDILTYLGCDKNIVSLVRIGRDQSSSGQTVQKPFSRRHRLQKVEQRPSVKSIAKAE